MNGAYFWWYASSTTVPTALPIYMARYEKPYKLDWSFATQKKTLVGSTCEITIMIFFPSTSLIVSVSVFWDILAIS